MAIKKVQLKKKNGDIFHVETEAALVKRGNSTVDADLSAVETTAGNAIPATEKGAKSGVATLGTDGKVPSSQLDLTSVTNDVAAINGKIPAAATADNKLVDLADLNAKLTEFSATFRGNFATYALLLAYTGTKDKNDYAVVQDASGDTSGSGHSGTWHYKYDGSAWSAEYQISETALTTAQLNALNSGITATKVSAYDGYSDTISGLSGDVSDLETALGALGGTVYWVAVSGTIPAAAGANDLIMQEVS
jgi:hypothetical protein